MSTEKNMNEHSGSSSRSLIKWLRGRWNGRLIMGASIKFKFSIEHFDWLPQWIRYANCFRWLWFYLWIHFEYE